MVTSLIADDPGHNQSVDVSYFAQTPDGQRRKPIIIDTPSQSVRSSIRLAEPEPVRVSVASLRNMSGERKYHATTFDPAGRIADASAARRSRWCRRNDLRRLLLGWLVTRQHRRQDGKRAVGACGHSRAGTRVRREIPRTAGRRGEASRAFEGRLVEASGRIPQGVRDPPG